MKRLIIIVSIVVSSAISVYILMAANFETLKLYCIHSGRQTTAYEDSFYNEYLKWKDDNRSSS